MEQRGMSSRLSYPFETWYMGQRSKGRKKVGVFVWWCCGQGRPATRSRNWI